MEAHDTVPWVEKYRPVKVDEISHQEEAKLMLRRVIQTGLMPNLLLYGPAGTGKTSAIHALCRELFGQEWRNRVMELNASDDRGIAVVRDKIKLWTRTYVSMGSSLNSTATNPKIPPWKIVILDEADMMTVDAQSALRRLIEDSSKNTRFAIICNYVTKIIDPIASRCAKFRFEPISAGAQVTRLRHIVTEENVKCEDAVLRSVVDISEGDLRVGITLLQTAAKVYSTHHPDDMTDDTTAAATDIIITLDDVCTVAGHPPESIHTELLQLCASGTATAVQLYVDDIIAGGWDIGQLFKQMNRALVVGPWTDVQKAKLGVTLAQINHRLTQGGNEQLQLLHFAMEIHVTFKM